jgi:CBS-domain-containing membrane protein
MRDAAIAGLQTGVLVLVAGATAVATGSPFLFPSLGPSAYVLVTTPDAEAAAPRRVVGGHAIGVVAGLLSYHLFARGLIVTSLPPAGSLDLGRLAVSGVLAVVLTTAGMVATDLRHAPACATTLIVGLGLLSTPFEGVVVVVAVILLVAVDEFGPR